MIQEKLIENFVEGLNAVSEMQYKVFVVVGNYQDAKRVVNTVEQFTQGVAMFNETDLLPIPNIKMFRTTANIEFAVNIDNAQLDSNGNYANVLQVINEITSYLQSVNAIPFEITDTDNTVYQIVPVYSLPTSDMVAMESSDLGEVVPISMTVEYLVSNGIASGNGYTLSIEGNNINFETMVITKQRTADQYSYSGSGNTKTNIIQGAIGIDVTMPQMLDWSGDTIMNDILGDNNNQFYRVQIGYPTRTGTQFKTYTMTFGQNQATVVKASNVGLNFSMVEVGGAQPLSEATWEQIAINSANGTAKAIYSVGEEKDITIGGVTYQAVILGFQQDTLADGSDTAGITFGIKQSIAPAQPFISGITSNPWWGTSYLRSYLANSIFNELSTDLQAVIKTVTKRSRTGATITTYENTDDKLFALSINEVCGGGTNEGQQYTFFANQNITQNSNGEQLAKQVGNVAEQPIPAYWWLRSVDPNSGYARVIAEPTQPFAYGYTDCYISFAFCV